MRVGSIEHYHFNESYRIYGTRFNSCVHGYIFVGFNIDWALVQYQNKYKNVKINKIEDLQMF